MQELVLQNGGALGLVEQLGPESDETSGGGVEDHALFVVLEVHTLDVVRLAIVHFFNDQV